MSSAKKIVFWAAVVVAVSLLPVAAWNGAVVSSKTSLTAAPPTLVEWGAVLSPMGGSLLSGLIAFATWASKYLTGKSKSVADASLPILLAMLDFEQGEQLARIDLTFVSGKQRTLKLADVTTAHAAY